jgi:hypothetical protein
VLIVNGWALCFQPSSFEFDGLNEELDSEANILKDKTEEELNLWDFRFSQKQVGDALLSFGACRHFNSEDDESMFLQRFIIAVNLFQRSF